MYSLADNLGSYKHNCIYNWILYISCNLTILEDWDQFKFLNLVELAITVDLDSSLLNTEQQKLYNIVIDQYIQELTYNDLLLLLFLNINRVAKSRKTFILLKTYIQLQELVQQSVRGNLVVYTILTSIVAFNIIRKTLYSLFQLPIKQKTLDLVALILQLLQLQFQDIQFIVIDKKLIINLKILSIINNCLQLIYLDQLDQAFRRLNILLYRDFFQLLSIIGYLLYISRLISLVALKGQSLY